MVAEKLNWPATDRETPVMMRARIGWATPWNMQSAIAQSASEVATELTKRGHTVTVLRTETGAWWDLPVPETRQGSSAT